MLTIHMEDQRNDLCPCSCHGNIREIVSRHIIACCQICNFCKRNIALAYYFAHVEECGKKSLEYFKDIARKH